MAKSKRKKARGKVILAGEYARKSLTALRPSSINDLVKKVKAVTGRRLAFATAKALYQEFRAKVGAPAPTADRPAPRARRAPARRPSAGQNGEQYLVVTRDRGFRLEVLRYMDKGQAERKATEMIGAGRKTRVLVANTRASHRAERGGSHGR
ncbi:MAG: hypothetical protein HYT87_19895 [Nitrospirae bacterium]|nr:hypothetical protein [Nitrospirota bacterium]